MRHRVMAGENGSDANQSWATPFFGFGPGQMEAATALQKELLEHTRKRAMHGSPVCNPR